MDSEVPGDFCEGVGGGEVNIGQGGKIAIGLLLGWVCILHFEQHN